MNDLQFHTMPGGRRIAFQQHKGTGPAIVFLPGYMSDMAGGKATALLEWSAENNRSCLLLDYSGCGASDGEFSEGRLTRWRDEVLAVINAQVQGPVIVVGSSMGGWLMLIVGLALGERLAGLVGIAAAPDFSDWGFSEEQKAVLSAGETVFEDSPYGPEPTPTYAKFWQDAEANRMLGSRIAITCPVHLLHGQKDSDVPWEISVRLAACLESGDVTTTLVKDGDHRLSRDEDIARLLRIVGET